MATRAAAAVATTGAAQNGKPTAKSSAETITQAVMNQRVAAEPRLIMA